MKRMGILLVTLVLVTGCGKKIVHEARVEHPTLPSTFEHAWVMRDSWFMACAIAVVSNKCWYWFGSDVADDTAPQYPIVLDCTFNSDGLRLQTTAQVYSINFLTVVTNGGTNLLAECDRSKPERLFRIHPRFNGTDPFDSKPEEKTEPGTLAERVPTSDNPRSAHKR